jgi:hypothetical protein
MLLPTYWCRGTDDLDPEGQAKARSERIAIDQ